MKKVILTLVTAVAVVAISAYILASFNNNNTLPKNTNTPVESTAGTGAVPPAADMAKDFTLSDLNGNKVTLSDLRGKKVFLNFWASWCPPCRAEMPDMERLFKENQSDEVVIVSVNIGESKDTVKSFMDKNGYTFMALLDSDSKVAAQYNIRAIPTSYFINKDGTVSAIHTGAASLQQMKEYLDAMN